MPICKEFFSKSDNLKDDGKPTVSLSTVIWTLFGFFIFFLVMSMISAKLHERLTGPVIISPIEAMLREKAFASTKTNRIGSGRDESPEILNSVGKNHDEDFTSEDVTKEDVTREKLEVLSKEISRRLKIIESNKEVTTEENVTREDVTEEKEEDVTREKLEVLSKEISRRLKIIESNKEVITEENVTREDVTEENEEDVTDEESENRKVDVTKEDVTREKLEYLSKEISRRLKIIQSNKDVTKEENDSPSTRLISVYERKQQDAEKENVTREDVTKEKKEDVTTEDVTDEETEKDSDSPSRRLNRVHGITEDVTDEEKEDVTKEELINSHASEIPRLYRFHENKEVNLKKQSKVDMTKEEPEATKDPTFDHPYKTLFRVPGMELQNARRENMS